jgi:GDPmannose 4,6-dehydratase
MNAGVVPPGGPPRTALVCGISGQDGAYLADLLLRKGYRVIGTSRDVSSMPRNGWRALGLEGSVELRSMAPNDFRSVLQTVHRAEADEIYYLAGQTSVGLSFEQPVEAIESISIGVLNLLEAIRFTGRPVRLYNAGSSECFGDTGGAPANRHTAFRPRSPYAVAKATAHMLVTNYREAYGLFACTGILFNHESPLRPERFVTQKIVRAAQRIAAGSREQLVLGNLDIHRDWGWAPDYVEAMWRMLDRSEPEDFVVATGRTVSLQYFVERAFAHFGLSWRDHTKSDSALLRPSDIRLSAADVAETTERLGWTATRGVDDVIRLMCEADRPAHDLP